MIAANYVESVAKLDGLTLGAVGPAMYIYQVTGKKEVRSIGSELSLIGSPEKTDRIFDVRRGMGIKAWQDTRTVMDTPKWVRLASALGRMISHGFCKRCRALS